MTPGLMISAAQGTGLALFKVTDPLGAGGVPGVAASFIDGRLPGSRGWRPEWLHRPPPDRRPRLQKTVYQNGQIWTSHTVSSTGAAGGKAEVRFYRVDPAGSGAVADADAVTDANLHFFFPALVPDAFGGAMAVFHGSSATTFASLYHARYNGATGAFEAPIGLRPASAPSPTTAGGTTVGALGSHNDAALDVLTGTHSWLHGALPVTTTSWKLFAARAASSTAPAPSNLVASPISGTRIDLAWTDNSTGEKPDRATLRHRRLRAARQRALNTTAHSDTTVTAGTAYSYRVIAVNAVGDSALQ